LLVLRVNSDQMRWCHEGCS